jgi:hypothetical protein
MEEAAQSGRRLPRDRRQQRGIEVRMAAVTPGCKPNGTTGRAA